MEMIISVCISVGVTLLVCIISNRSHRLNELTKKVEKHNFVVERTHLLEEKVNVANHRIKDLEDEKKGEE